MSVKLNYNESTSTLEMTVDGKLEKSDYEKIAPVVDDLVDQHGWTNLLIVLHDFDGWTAGALWEDLKLDMKHYNDIRRIAVVGDSKWEEGLTRLSSIFTSGEVRFFEREALADARTWTGATVNV